MAATKSIMPAGAGRSSRARRPNGGGFDYKRFVPGRSPTARMRKYFSGDAAFEIQRRLTTRPRDHPRLEPRPSCVALLFRSVPGASRQSLCRRSLEFVFLFRPSTVICLRR